LFAFEGGLLMPEQSYDTIAAPAAAELVEKRSRFLAEIRPVSDESQCAAFVAEQKARYHDARHNCSAWILRVGNILRYSDDGEPQGTAGVPILEVIRREGLTDVAVVVTRYFGGILLGAGGLNRAYSHSAKRAVDAARRVRMCRCALFMLEIPYPLYDKVQLLLGQHGAAVLDSAFGVDVTLTLRLEASALPALEARLTELSGGQVRPVLLGEEFAAISAEGEK